MFDKVANHSVKVQDLINQDIFEDTNSSSDNDLLEVLQFTQRNGVPLTSHQVKAWFLMQENGIEDIAMFANAVRPHMTPTRKIFDMVNKITLADRIKGNAKLSNLLKSSLPSASTPSPNELQPKALREKELNR